MDGFDNYYLERWKKTNRIENIGQSKQKRLDLLKSCLNELKVYRFLDYGCGNGWLYTKLGDYPFLEYHIYDITPSVVKAVKELFPEVKEWYGNGDLPSEITSNYFDFVTSIEVLEHVPFSLKQDFLVDVYRVLQKGGYYFLTTPNGRYKSSAMPKDQEQPVEDWLTKSEVISMLRKSGFHIVRSGTWYLTENLSLLHRFIFNYRLIKILKLLSLYSNYVNLLGKLGFGLSMYFLCKKN